MVWRDDMIFKLLEQGIASVPYSIIIQKIYKRIKVEIKLPEGILVQILFAK